MAFFYVIHLELRIENCKTRNPNYSGIRPGVSSDILPRVPSEIPVQVSSGYSSRHFG